MITQTQWSETTKKIFYGILMYSIAGILHGILDPISSLESAVSMFSGSSGGGLIGTICYILMAAIIVGYVLTFLGLSGFRKILEEEDASSIGKVRMAFILAIIAAGVGFIPLDWVSGILNIIAFILMLLGYSALKKSTTFPEMARKGASTLFIALILLLVGTLIGFIPLVGSIIKGVLSIIAYIMTFVGWKKIAKTQI